MTAYWPQCDIFPHLRLPVYFLEACGHLESSLLWYSQVFSTSSFPIHPCISLGAKCFAPQGHEHSLYSPLPYLKFCIFPMHLELISMEFWVRLRFYFFFYVDILSLQCSSPVIYSDASIDTPQPSAPALIKALFSVAHIVLVIWNGSDPVLFSRCVLDTSWVLFAITSTSSSSEQAITILGRMLWIWRCVEGWLLSWQG